MQYYLVTINGLKVYFYNGQIREAMQHFVDAVDLGVNATIEFFWTGDEAWYDNSFTVTYDSSTGRMWELPF